MKPILITAITAATLLAASSPARAESTSEIVQKFEEKKVAALTEYLEANPDAPDTAEALTALVEAYQVLGNTEQAGILLEKKYDAIDKGPDANLQVVIGETFQPLLQFYGASDQKDKAIALIERARKDLKDHPSADQLTEFFDQISGQISQPGQPSKGDTLEIAFTATDGTEVDLSKMAGKVVLVDFWATWCPPCVAEMPNVIAAYNKFHDKGFEVIGISLDQDKETLLSYTKENKMPWPQYFDGKGWSNEIAGQYGIRGIPATFLIGKDGKIAATDLRGQALESQLEELLAE
jgi:thiol-disulfide isomerase/thioredoxin